ncbi:HAMP domain-containing protein [Alkalicaulis satelles]|uniref:histidine kinase n=1 Tax=Alkalicaulis satelles TaxID=2609175 RepID=A0A5M6ZH65_9PROT|nr:HAMP domain-containing protein [Alkalicaulis satelles]
MRLTRLPPLRLWMWIAGVNALALIVMAIGMYAITEARRGLVAAKLDSLTAQAEIISSVITETAVYGDEPGPRMDNDSAREVLRRLSSLYVPAQSRAILHAPGPSRIADSDLIAGQVETTLLPPPGEAPSAPSRPAGDLLAPLGEWISMLWTTRETRAYLDLTLADEVALAFETGDPQRGVRRAADGSRVVSVTLPIQLIQAVVGTVTYESYDLDELIAEERVFLTYFLLTAFVIIFVGTVLLTVSIARPLSRLAHAARQVRLAGGARVPMPQLGRTIDEIGALSTAFIQMTNALYDRLDAIESFAADVAHEIKNPLTSIRSAAEILPSARDDAQRARLIAVIQHDVRRLDRLITDISNASRLDAELAREDLALIDLERLLGDIAGLYRPDPDADEPGAEVVLESAGGPLVMRGHEGPLSRVFINLVDNARTFSPEGARVRVTARRAGGAHGRLIVTVEDEGPGIPEESLESIFERFYTKRPDGTAFGAHSGLGLAIARQIINAHGGTIRAGNRTRGGAVFTVDLPAAR